MKLTLNYIHLLPAYKDRILKYESHTLRLFTKLKYARKNFKTLGSQTYWEYMSYGRNIVLTQFDIINHIGQKILLLAFGIVIGKIIYG